MKNKMKYLTVSLFSVLLAFLFSCKHYNEDVVVPYYESQQSSSAMEFRISGIVSPYNGEDVTRTAFPSDPSSSDTFYYTIKAVCGSDTVTQDINSSYTSEFAINIPHAGDWNVTAECFKNPARTELHYKTVDAVTVSITASAPYKYINLKLKPLMTESGKGNFDLTILYDTAITSAPYSFDVSDSAHFVAICTSSNKANVEGKVDFNSRNPGRLNFKSIADTKSGSYTFDLNFYSSSNEILFSTTQVINIYDNMITDKWVKQGDEPYFVDDGSGGVDFKLTTALLNRYKLTTIYVDSSAAAGGNGSWLSPYNNLDDAITLYNDSNSVITAIYLSGTFSTNKFFDLGTANRNLTIKKNPQSPSRAEVYCSASDSFFCKNVNKLVIDNINFTGQGIGDSDPVTGNGSGGSKSGAFLYNEKDVEISNCNISKFMSDTNGILLNYNSDAKASLTNVNITNCKTTGLGGAVFNFDATVTLDLCKITSCYAANGAGIFISASMNTSKLTLKDSSISGCVATAVDTNTGKGGGLLVSNGNSEVTLVNSSISDCSAQNGGGIYINNGTVTLDENSVIGKTGVSSYATEANGKHSNKCANNGHGGGVFIELRGELINKGKISYNLSGGVYLTDAAILDNTDGEISYNGYASTHTARYGGGVCYDTININSTLAGNILNNYAQSGGGVYFKSENNLTITATISNNHASFGSAIFAFNDSASAYNSIELKGTISGNDYSSEISAIYLYNIPAYLYSSTTILPDQTIFIADDSPANATVYIQENLSNISEIKLIPDGSLNSGYAIVTANSADLITANKDKIKMDDPKTYGLIQSGQYEILTRNYYVKEGATATGADGSYSKPYPLISTALSNLLPNTTAATIYVDGTITENTKIEVESSSSLTNLSICKCPYGSVTTAGIKRGTNTTSMFTFNKSNLNIVMEGITIDGSTRMLNASGAGICCKIGDATDTEKKSALTLKNVIIVGCKTTKTGGGFGGQGGAIYCSTYDGTKKYYTLTLEGCTIGNSLISGAPDAYSQASNSASDGGGIYISSSAISTTIKDTTIAGNYASNGGAVYSYNRFTAENSNFIKNTANLNGGAVFAEKGFVFKSGLISGNKVITAGNKSAGVHTVTTIQLYDGASFGENDTVELGTNATITISSSPLTLPAGTTLIATLYKEGATTGTTVLSPGGTGYIATNYQKFAYDGAFEIDSTGKLTPAPVYVDGSAAASGTGKENSPYKLLSEAITIIPTGGTVYVKGNVSETAAITVDKDLTILKWTGETTAPKITRNGTTTSMLTVSSGKTVTIKDIDFDGSNTELTGVDGGIIKNRGILTLENVNIENGHVRNQTNEGQGGGIYNGGTLTMTGGSVCNSSAEDGGGIYNVRSCILENVEISGNWTANGGIGAGICNGNTLTIMGTNETGTVIKNNGKDETGYITSQGGGIRSMKSFTVTGKVTITGNKATIGAGMALYDENYSFSQGLVITDNTALNSGTGGGIYVSSPLTLNGVSISGNTTVSGKGAGIFTNNVVNLGATQTIDTNNDVYLDSSSTVNLTTQPTATGTIAKLTVANPSTRTTAILTGTGNLVADNFSKFGLTHGNTYYITSEGKINQKLESEELFALLTEAPTDTSKVYIMDTQAEFEKLSTWVSTGNYLAGIQLKLNSNITVTGTWTPILKFSGIFDGNNKSIDLGTQSYSDEINVGLFGKIDNAEVRNITVSGNITNSYSYFATTGAIAGDAINSTIIGCTNNATIIGGQFTGGIVGCTDKTGLFDSPQGTTTISNCTNAGNVTGSQFTGGIVGWHNGQGISNCTNTGAIVATTNVGQIVGTNSPGAPVTGSTESGSATKN